jgi:group II intron reverse transcriptase/maturase
MENSLSEKPKRLTPRRLSDHLKLEGQKKVHSLVDKIYKRKNLELAWEKVRSNQGAPGADGVSIEEFEKDLERNLFRLHDELRDSKYQPQPVRRIEIEKRGAPGKTRPLGIPSVYDRVCQQAFVNRLEPIFEKIFDHSSFGYRKGLRPGDALTKIWREIDSGHEWIVDADLRDYFGSVDHEKLMTMVSQQISDGRVLRLIKQMLEAGYVESGKLYATPVGTPQGGVISPLLSNILLTPFDKEMRQRGYRLTRFADDWVVTCTSKAEAVQCLKTATKILKSLGVTLNAEKTRIVHVAHGFEFLGYKIKQGKGQMKLSSARIKSKLNKKKLYARPTEKSITRFKDQLRNWTQRKVPLTTEQLIDKLNPIIRGWGNYYRKSHVRRLFNLLDRWIVRRIWSHRLKRWRNAGWKTMPNKRLRGEYGLVSLISLIPSLQTARASL